VDILVIKISNTRIYRHTHLPHWCSSSTFLFLWQVLYWRSNAQPQIFTSSTRISMSFYWF